MIATQVERGHADLHDIELSICKARKQKKKIIMKRGTSEYPWRHNQDD